MTHPKITLGILLLLSLLIVALFYFVPRKIGFPKVGKFLSLIIGIIVVAFSILAVFQNELFPNSVSDYYCQKGVDEHMSGKYEKAIKYYKKVIKINPTYNGIYYNIGLSKVKLKDYKGAILEYNKELELNPENSLVFNNRANAKFNLGQYQEAILDYNKSLEINPEYADAYYNRALCKIQLNDTNGIYNDLFKAVDLGNLAAIDKIKGYSTKKIDKNTNVFYKASDDMTDSTAKKNIQ